MKQTYIIDGYNLGFKIPAIAEKIKSGQTELAVRQIVSKVQSMVKGNAGSVIIVFDGKYGNRNSVQGSGLIKIKFTRKPKIADDEIREMIRNRKPKELLTIVSSDNEIRFTAQDHGVKVLRSEEFLKSFKDRKAKHAGESSEKPDPGEVDIDYWLDQFRSKSDD